ncbi:replication initiation and membrane attachment family protein [Bacillus songklensis]|uniref:Replication initiation and membrane attachment family protein n=1 Tax=Bacillus songklensis TaxID=1069116 RepID=A0ABV8B0Y0_9BACI
MAEQHWKELIPVDRYIVRSNGILQDYDRKVLTMLYQPLVGSVCFSLYMTLWSELEQDRLWGKESTHHYLMAMMQMNLRTIYEERLKLEGIGLLKTYVKQEEDSRLFVYELMPPLTPEQFFNDGVLNIYLYNRLGKSIFQKVKHYFSDRSLEEGGFQSVTRSFNDVFRSLHTSEMISNIGEEAQKDLRADPSFQYMSTSTKGHINIIDETFDFELFYAGLSESLVPKKAITTKVKNAIEKLAFLYGIDALQMKNIVLSSLDENDQIDIELLRKSARDFYQFEHGNELPHLVEQIQSAALRTMNEKVPQTQEEQLIRQLETISPKQLLIELSGGAEPAQSDLQIIEDVLFHQKLTPGVVNVLIYYVMLKADMKLSKAYVEKIASHWARKKIKTVKEAMELAKHEQKQYQNWTETKQAKRSTRKTAIRKEIVPDWLQGKKEEKKEKKEEAPAVVDFEEEKRKLEEELQQYRQRKQT